MQHNCEHKMCNGKKLNGLFFNCAQCGSKAYIECLLKKEEVASLLVSMDIVLFQNNEFIPNIERATLAKHSFESIFNTNSVIKYMCEECMSDGSDIETLRKYNSELRDELHEKNGIIQSMTEAHENPDKIIDTGVVHNDDKRNDIAGGFSAEHNALIATVKEMLTSETEKMSAKIESECKKVKKFCKDKLVECQKEAKNVSPKQNPFRTESNTKNKKGVPYAPQQSDDEKKVVFNDTLLPPKQKENNATFEYCLHVSKFDVDKKVEDIVEHIMQNTAIIDPCDFNVEKLGNPTSDFASFKVSTNTNEWFEQIKSM